MKRTLLAASIATLFSTAYGADIQLNPVTASSYYDSLDSDSPKNSFRTPKSSSGHTQVIGREEIEQLRPNDTFDLLNMATGVVSSPNNNRMGFSFLSIRGDTNFRWIIDGAYLDATTASRVMRSIPVAAIEEIKVVRGSSALTMGPMTNTENPTGGAAVNGFIVVSTRKPNQDEIQLRYARESNHGEDQSVWGGKRFNDLNGYLATLISKTKSGSPDEKLDSGVGYNIDRQSTKGLVKGGINQAGWDVNWMSYQDDGSYQIPNANSHYPVSDSSTYRNWRVDPSQTIFNSFNGSKAWGEGHVTMFSLSNIEARQKVHDVTNGSNNATNEQDSTHVNIKHNIDFQNTRLMFGGDYRHWEAPYGQNPAYYANTPREEVTKGWFVQAEQKLMDGKLMLDGAYRKDSVYVVKGLNFIFGGSGAGATNTKIYNQQLPMAEFISFGSRYNLTSTWAVNARYAFSSMPIKPGVLPSNGVVLSDDKQDRWELGLEGNVSKSFKPSINYFYKSVKNEKTINGYYATNTSDCATNPTSTGAKINPCYTQADTTRAGVELAVSGLFADRSTYRASWTHFTKLEGNLNKYSTGYGGNGTTTMVPLSEQTPSDIAELVVSHGVSRYTLSGSVKYVSDYFGVSNGYTYPTISGAQSGYTRLDLGVSYDWKLSDTPMKTTVYGKNITDKKYETSAGIQDVGRILGIELIASFK